MLVSCAQGRDMGNSYSQELVLIHQTRWQEYHHT